MENLQHDHLTQMGLDIDGQIKQDLYEGAKWAKFISILMFIASGFILLFGLAGGSMLMSLFRGLGARYGMLSEMGGGILILIFLLVAVVMAVMYYFLFQFSVKTKTALLSENSTEFNTGLKSLKNFFIISTVVAILGLLLNIINLF
jgi:uncharacterized membrane protein